jgi:hypothetical protein
LDDGEQGAGGGDVVGDGLLGQQDAQTAPGTVGDGEVEVGNVDGAGDPPSSVAETAAPTNPHDVDHGGVHRRARNGC